MTKQTQPKNQNNEVSRFLVVPSFLIDLVSEKTISANDAYLLAIITGLSKKDGFCYASNRHLAKLCGFQIKTIKNKLALYKRLGLIEVEVIRNDRNVVEQRRIKVLFDISPIDPRPSGGTTPGPSGGTTSSPRRDLDNKEDNKDVNNKDLTIKSSSSENKNNFMVTKVTMSDDSQTSELGIVYNKETVLKIFYLLDKFGFTSYKYLSDKKRRSLIRSMYQLCVPKRYDGSYKKGREWMDDNPLINLYAFLYMSKRVREARRLNGNIRITTLLEWLREWIDTKGKQIIGENMPSVKSSAFRNAYAWFEAITEDREEEYEKEEKEKELSYKELVEKWKKAKSLDELHEVEMLIQAHGFWEKFLDEYGDIREAHKKTLIYRRSSSVSKASDIIANLAEGIQ